MKGLLNTVQKQIGLLISVSGLAVGITNVIDFVMEGASFGEIISALSVWSVFLFTLPFIVSIFLEHNFLKKLQIFVFILVGTFNIIDAYQEFYGPAMFLAAWLLMRHYGYLEAHTRAKNTSILIAITFLSQLSAYLHTRELYYAGLTTLLFTFFLIVLIIIIWRDLVRQQQALRQENRSLQMDYHKLASQLRELETEQKPFDLKSVKISPAEERVIEILTVYKASNREIAERLNLAESTVKLHLYNIYNKIGVDNRFAIIDLCKYNFRTSTNLVDSLPGQT